MARRIAFRRLEKFQEFEADAHPLASGDVLGAAVGDAANQINRILLHLFVPVLQISAQSRQEIFNRWRHSRHPLHAHDGFERAEDGAQDFGILLAEVFVEHDAQVTQKLLLFALSHHRSDGADQVSRLFTNIRRLVVHAPLDGATNLRKIRLGAKAERVDNGSDALEHDVALVRGLLLERVEHAVDQELLHASVHVRRSEFLDHLGDGFHHHATVRFGFILQIFDDATDDFSRSDFQGDFKVVSTSC